MKTTADAQQEETLKRRKRYADQRRNDLIAILSMPQGQRVFGDLFQRAGIFRKHFTGNSQTYHSLGKAELGLEIFDECMDADADTTLAIIKTNRSKAQ